LIHAILGAHNKKSLNGYKILLEWPWLRNSSIAFLKEINEIVPFENRLYMSSTFEHDGSYKANTSYTFCTQDQSIEFLHLILDQEFFFLYFY
jgi:hypothetical protein